MIYVSPDGSHQAILIQESEIRFGPPLYSLIIDGISFNNRIFSDNFVWSPDSRYFAIMEWSKIAKESILLVIDLHNHKECIVTILRNGVIFVKQFEKYKLIYNKELFGKKGFQKEFEIDIINLNRWKPII